MSNTICFISTHHVDENFTWTRTPSKQVSWRLFTLHKHHFEYLVKHFPLHAQALWVCNWVNVVGPYFRSWPHPRALKTRSVISRTLLYTRRVSLSRPFLLSKRPAEVLNNISFKETKRMHSPWFNVYTKPVRAWSLMFQDCSIGCPHGEGLSYCDPWAQFEVPLHQQWKLAALHDLGFRV